MTPLNIGVFLLSLAGFVALAAGMSKHAKHLLRRELPPAVSRLLRALGWLLLAAALAIGIRQWHADVGLVTWLGWLTVAGLLLVFYLPRWPWQPVTKAAKPRPEKPYTPAPRSSRHVALGALLLAAPLVLFTWQLIITPERPLLRDDALHGQIGPWTFSLAEQDKHAPEIVALGVPLKTFVIRFCDACQRDIRQASLKIRQPHNTSAAGNAFAGRGTDKRAEIPVPRAASQQDGLWLTVEGTDGSVHQQRFAIERLSPALARFIEEQP